MADIRVTRKNGIDVTGEFSPFILVYGVRYVGRGPLDMNFSSDAALGAMLGCRAAASPRRRSSNRCGFGSLLFANFGNELYPNKAISKHYTLNYNLAEFFWNKRTST